MPIMGFCIENVGDAFAGYVFGNLYADPGRCDEIYIKYTHDM